MWSRSWQGEAGSWNQARDIQDIVRVPQGTNLKIARAGFYTLNLLLAKKLRGDRADL